MSTQVGTHSEPQLAPMRVETRALRMQYSGKTALQDVSVSFEPGTVTGLIGPNGSGKSTLLKMMLGLARGSGEVFYGGRHLGDYQFPGHVVGAHLDPSCLPDARRTGTYLRAMAIANGTDRTRADELISSLGLESVATSRIGTFSLGMRQRLGLALALVAQPRVLLLDEPANGLDPASMRWLRGFLRQYAAQGNTVCVSSHLLGELEETADRIVGLSDGRIITDAAMDQLLNATSRITLESPDLEKLVPLLLAEPGGNVEIAGPGAVVTGITRERIAELALSHLIAITAMADAPLRLEDAIAAQPANDQYRITA